MSKLTTFKSETFQDRALQVLASPDHVSVATIDGNCVTIIYLSPADVARLAKTLTDSLKGME